MNHFRNRKSRNVDGRTVKISDSPSEEHRYFVYNPVSRMHLYVSSVGDRDSIFNQIMQEFDEDSVFGEHAIEELFTGEVSQVVIENVLHRKPDDWPKDEAYPIPGTEKFLEPDQDRISEYKAINLPSPADPEQIENIARDVYDTYRKSHNYTRRDGGGMPFWDELTNKTQNHFRAMSVVAVRSFVNTTVRQRISESEFFKKHFMSIAIAGKTKGDDAVEVLRRAVANFIIESSL